MSIIANLISSLYLYNVRYFDSSFDPVYYNFIRRLLSSFIHCCLIFNIVEQNKAMYPFDE